VPLRPIIDALGLSWPAQTRRLERDLALAGEVTVAVMATIQGPRAMLCLPLKLLPGFLFGITASRVKPELQDKIVRYQRDCYEVLWNAFKADILPPPPASSTASGAALALEIAEAIATLARQQLALEGRFDQLEGRVGTMADYLRSNLLQTAQRLDALELRLSEGATISEAEAAELALHVKTVAHALEQKGTANGYQRVYGELYRRFRIASYKNLPRARFAEALAWLAEWARELEKDSTV
jgi:hypothetical protein